MGRFSAKSCFVCCRDGATRKIIFNELMQFFVKNGLDSCKVVSVITVVGHHRGLISRLAGVNPELITFHFIIHKSVLCAKLSVKMKETMNTVMRLVNFSRKFWSATSPFLSLSGRNVCRTAWSFAAQ